VVCALIGEEFVAFKMGCRQGAARAHARSGLKPNRNAAASPFSTQPEGLWHIGDFSALIARARSIRILPLALALKNRQCAYSKLLAN